MILAVVHHRQVEHPRQAKLRLEEFRLPRQVTVRHVSIEADLPHRHRGAVGEPRPYTFEIVRLRPRHATVVEGFGTVDLPAVSTSPADLPAVRPGQPAHGAPPARAPRTQVSAGFGEVDLPSFDEPASPGPLSDPRPRGRSAGWLACSSSGLPTHSMTAP